ncbi:hypothetical protein SAMN05216389_12625 [Oceanobacillus limi]|uniref:Uncharacterized protein n=1 Tax=Oceanobacillus limi TaxID=930131 RepID=A0A1I0H268_9BACI|nr:hypothetical protein [Oceanobacillus limi]SET76790.1 hypothetical protein SAMN05216389_12625 [Oceanobacillus limi]
MNDVTMYYEHFHDEKIPLWFVVENIDWSNSILYLTADPDNESDISYFHHDDWKVSVLLSDLLRNHSKKNYFGINLSNIELRINEHGYTTDNVKELVIRVVDIKEIMYMDRVIDKNL